MARRIGIWFIGAKGGVATTSIVGLLALKRQLTGPQGLVTQLPLFGSLDLAGWDDFVIGGHDIRTASLYDEAMQLARVSRAIDPELVEKLKDDLAAIDSNLRPGTLVNVGATIEKFADDELRKKPETPRTAIDRIQADLKAFATANKLDQVIVMNVASTEPPLDETKLPQKWDELAKLLETKDCPLAASSIYAIAALELGYPYVNFTPSTGSAPAAMSASIRSASRT